MQGQSNHFTRYAPEKIPYGISRYQNETRRLYRVMDTALAKSTSGFLVGDRVTIADMSCWGWVAAGSKSPVSAAEALGTMSRLTVAIRQKRVGWRRHR